VAVLDQGLDQLGVGHLPLAQAPQHVMRAGVQGEDRARRHKVDEVLAGRLELVQLAPAVHRARHGGHGGHFISSA